MIVDPVETPSAKRRKLLGQDSFEPTAKEIDTDIFRYDCPVLGCRGCSSRFVWTLRGCCIPAV